MTDPVVGEQFLSPEARLLRKLAVRLGTVLWILDESGEDLRYADGGFADLWGLTVSELSADSRAWKHAIVDEDRALALHGLREATQGRVSTSEFRVRRPDGATRWVSNRAFIFDTEDGTVQGLAGFLTDVTEERTAHLALERRAALLELGVKVGQLSVWEYAVRGPRPHDSVPFEVRAAPGFEGGEYITLAQVWSMMGVDEADVERGMHEIKRCMDGETEEWMFDYQNRRPGMGHPWRLLRGIVRRSSESTPISIVGVGYDITAQRQLQENYRRAKEQAERAAKIARLSHWTFRMVDGFVRNARVDLGVSIIAPGYQEDPSAIAFPAAVTAVGMHHEDLPAVIDAIQDCVDGKTLEFQIEYRSTDKAGTRLWRHARGTVERAPDGTPLSFTASAIDITGRRLAEEESRRIKQRQELALRGSGVDLWELDLSGSDASDNQPAFVHIYESGGSGAVSPGKRALAIEIEPADREHMKSAIRAVLNGDTGEFQVEHRVKAQDDTIRWKLSRGARLPIELGERPNLVGASVDITDLKRTQHELQEAKNLAERANRAKDEFLANVSHEIRTPMNAILGMTELVMEQAITQHQRQLLQTSKSATNSLLGIINDLLDFAKIEAGKLELERAELSLRATVWDTLRALAVRAHRKGLELVCEFAPDVPDALVGDAARLRQMLVNIVGNAIKFTERGEVVVRVSSCDGEPSESTVTLKVSVRDTGVGIPPEKIPRIFRAFEQEDTSTTRRYGGTGLGLSIAADLAALMHGALHVESELGRGSTFVFTAKLERLPHAAASSRPLPPAYLRGLPVLVVDDNATHSRFLEDCLRSWEMLPMAVGDVLTATGALSKAAEAGHPYALVLLDSCMPETDNLSLVTRIREQARLSTLKIVLLTPAGTVGALSGARDLPIDAEWFKPLQPEYMLDEICQVLSRQSRTPGTRPDSIVEARSEVASPRWDDRLGSHAAAALRILVVEDDEFSAMFVRELLTRRSYRVTVSANATEALDVLERGGIDLMLLDVRMANTDGFDVVRIVRERERVSGERLPVIALTARSPQQDRDRCLAAGADDILTKPVRSAELLAAIARLISKVGSLTQVAALGNAASERQSVGGPPRGPKR